MIIINEVEYEPFMSYNLTVPESLRLARRKRAQEIKDILPMGIEGKNHDASTFAYDMGINKKGADSKYHAHRELERINDIKRNFRSGADKEWIEELKKEIKNCKDPNEIKKLKKDLAREMHLMKYKNLKSLPFKKQRKLKAVEALNNRITKNYHKYMDDADKNKKDFFSADNKVVKNKSKVSTLIKGDGSRASEKETLDRYYNIIYDRPNSTKSTSNNKSNPTTAPKSTSKPPRQEAPKPDRKLLLSTPKSTSKPPRQETPRSNSTPPRQETPKSNGLQIAAPKSNGSWFGRNKGKVALGVGVTTAAAYGIHRYRQNKKKKEEEDRRQAETEAKKKTGLKRFLNR